MADKNASALATLTGAAVAAGDLLLVHDVSEAGAEKLKSMTRTESFNLFATAAQGTLADSALQDLVDDTSPQLGGQLDINGNSIGDGTLELLSFSETASAVNELTITNAATAGSPSLIATGGDANIDLTLDGKGTGTVKTLSSNLDITGNIIVSGTVDGIDIATDVAANTAKVTNATHTGDVTGSGALTIAAKAVEISMLADGTDGELITWSAAGVATTVAVGTANQVLTSNGVGAAPTFQAAAGGLANIVEDTTPQLGGQLDINGNSIGDGALELLSFIETASAVNELTITNAATAGSPSLTTTGGDTNIDLTLDGKGSGTVKTLSSNLDITGNIIVSGTVDGIDIATDVAANTAKVTNATHTGDVTGSGALTIANKAVTIAMLADGTDGELITWDASGVAATVAVGSANQILTSNGTGAAPTFQADPVEMVVAVSDETSVLTTGTAKLTFRMPYAMTLSEVRASVGTAPTGSVLTVDINETGSTILSTKITIDATEKTSTTAAIAPVISDTALADDAEMTVDIDGVGATIAGAGLKVTLIGTRA